MIIRRIIGKKGRTTIPYVMRCILDIKENDVVAYYLTEDRSAVIVTKEDLCSGCNSTCTETNDEELLDFVRSLPDKDQKRVLVSLLDKFAPKAMQAMPERRNR